MLRQKGEPQMIGRKQLQPSAAGVRDASQGGDEGWWIMMDSTTENAETLPTLAHRAGNVSRAATQPEDTRRLRRRIDTLLQSYLRQPSADARPLPVYLRRLIGALRNAPREPLAQAILALRLTRLRNGRVFVLTEEARTGLGSRLVADLRRREINALLVTRSTLKSDMSAGGDLARIDTLLRPGDVVIGMQGDSPAYADVIEAAKAADTSVVLFGIGPDHGDKDVCAIACGGERQALDARLFFSHLICVTLGDLEARTASEFRGARLRQVS